MCVKNISRIFCNCLFLLFYFMPFCVYSQDVQQPQTRWFLISEQELQSIENYRLNREKEKQSWQLQVRNLKQDSVNLNDQLAQARDQNRRLETSFNKSENEKLTLLSSKDGEIAELKQEAADEKIKSLRRLFIIIGLAEIIFVYCGIRVYLFIKLGK